MGSINVKTASLTEVGNKLKRLTNNVDAIGKSFSSVRSSLDSDVRGKSGIVNDIKNSSDDLNNIEKVLRNASRYIDEVVKSYSGDERRLAQFVAKMNLRAVSERSCSSVTEVMLEAMYYGVKGWEAVQAIVQSGFFGDAGTISSDLSHSRELLFAKSNASGAAKIDKVKTASAKAYIQQEKELSWDEVLEYAAYKSPEDREWVEKVKEMLKNPYIPYEAKNSMIEALRPKAVDMWNILENSPIPSNEKEKIKIQSYDKNTKQANPLPTPSPEPTVDGKIIGSQEYIDMIEKLMTDAANKYLFLPIDKVSQMIAIEGLNRIKQDIKNNSGQLDNISQENFMRLCNKVNSLVWRIGAVDQDTHYFRNHLNRAPKTLEEMVQLNKSLPSEKKWRLLPPDKAIYHMYGTDGEYNLKFVSADGFFEAVYSKDGTLLTQSNDGINMGTYNYADPEANAVQHALYDVLPYYSWGNVAGVPKPSTSEFANLDRYNANSDAQSHYNSVLNQLK